MFSRRDVMLGAVTAATAALAWRPNAILASASQPSTPVNFEVPEGACDCHVHTFDPQHFPYSPSRPYTPEPVSVDELRSLHKALHISRVIVVQTTVYGADNSGVLDALKQLGFRGIARNDFAAADEFLAIENVIEAALRRTILAVAAVTVCLEDGLGPGGQRRICRDAHHGCQNPGSRQQCAYEGFHDCLLRGHEVATFLPRCA